MPLPPAGQRMRISQALIWYILLIIDKVRSFNETAGEVTLNQFRSEYDFVFDVKQIHG